MWRCGQTPSYDFKFQGKIKWEKTLREAAERQPELISTEPKIELLGAKPLVIEPLKDAEALDLKLLASDPLYDENPEVGELLKGDYEVERIEQITKEKKGRKFVETYLVKWKGHPESENSWVKSSQIDAPVLIAECRARRKAEIAQRKLQVSNE